MHVYDGYCILFSLGTAIGVALMYFPSLVFSLPPPSLPNTTYGSPAIWTIQLFKGNVSLSALDTPINITFPHVTEVRNNYTQLHLWLCIQYHYNAFLFIPLLDSTPDSGGSEPGHARAFARPSKSRYNCIHYELL